jgi:hypothetical protein
MTEQRLVILTAIPGATGTSSHIGARTKDD